MKKIFLFLFLLSNLTIFAQGGWGDPSNNQLQTSDIKGAKVSWKFDSKVVGDIPQGKPITVNYEFTNTGNAPLIISNVEPACDCTAADWPKNPVMPGQKAIIAITFNAEKTGKFSKAATVKTNANPTTYTLVFTGTVVAN